MIIRHKAIRILASLSIIIGIFSANFALPQETVLAAPDCVHPPNKIVAENCLTGNPPSQWDVTGAGDANIQGYATDISVNQGETVNFKVNTDASDYRLDIYRLGYYGGDGARYITTIQPGANLPQVQPPCLFDPTDGINLVDCGKWVESASWEVPPSAVSGVYIARLVREDAIPGASHITFIVRDDTGHSDLLFQTSDSTWQAYNDYGGYSLYQGYTGHASKVSYNRPFSTRTNSTEDFLFNSEYPMIRWLERNGYDVSYSTDLDTDRRGAELLEHKIFMSVGHDEYWSAGQRAAVEAARNAGVNLAFLSGNEIYWKTRWEPSTEGSTIPYRTLVAYKDGSLANGGSSEHYNCYKVSTTSKCDPLPGVWTGLWRDGCGFSPALDACKPENALSGNISWVGTTSTIQVPAEDGKMRFWRNTSVASLSPGTNTLLEANTLGYEWDFEQYPNSYPAGRFWLSTTLADGRTHHLSLYRAPGGALVFGAGTVQWAWGLDGNHDRGSSTEDTRMQQATLNLFADMGVQPGSIQDNLSLAAASVDVTPPSSTITSPTSGSTVNGAVTISGTALDTGGAVGAVDVSVDGGTTWQPASGRETWTLSWTPSTLGTYTVLSRAVDDSGNLETPSAGITLTVEPRTCPCTLWDPSNPAGPDDGDTQTLEVGVKFHSDLDGWVTGIRFYKHTTNTGTHIGNLWSSTGANLGSVTFLGETSSGWQEASFAAPIAVTANTTYVASYFTSGHYASSQGYFASAGLDNPPLHALQDGVDGANGVYVNSSTSAFPTLTWKSSNYWVDLVFVTEVGPDTTPPQVSSTAPANHATNVALSSTVAATFNEAVDPGTITAGGNFELRDASSNLIPATVSYSAATRTALLTPDSALTPSTTYTATLKGGPSGVADLAGNRLVSDYSWTFTTAAPPPLPPNEGPGGPILVIADASNVSNPFGRYYAEILRAEGFNAYFVTDISTVTASTLSTYNVVLLGEMSLSDNQVSMFDTWVAGGGNLIAFRPAKSLATLYGLTDANSTTSEGYLAVNTSTSIGKGVAGDTLQFHGVADNYTLSGSTSLATLYSNATTTTSFPAIVRYSRGNGQVVIFTFDLARSIVLMRQGNPAWAGQEGDDVPGIRASDMFVGRNGQPNWIDTTKLLIPQADEQMHVLSHAIEQLNATKLPLPRLWYFPNLTKGALIMTGDSEGCSGACVNTPMQDANAHGGTYTAYLLGNGPTLAEVNGWLAAGNEVAPHYDDTAEAGNPTYANMNAVYDTTTQNFINAYGFAPRTVRNHWIVWTGWADQARIEAAHGIGLDTNYYHYGPWLTGSGTGPGYFTGSGLPLRFSDETGHILDIFQATTQLPDETWFQSIDTQFKTLIDRSIDQGYYGFLTANFHPPSYGTYQTVAGNMMTYAASRGVPIWSAEKLLDFLQARNQARFEKLAWDGTHLTFDFNQLTPYTGLTMMIPARAGGNNLLSIQSGGIPVTFNIETIKGYDYALFAANNGSYSATYEADTTPPAITGQTPPANAADVAITTNVTATFSEGMNPGTISSSSFHLRAEGAGSDVSAVVTYDDVTRMVTLNPDINLAYDTLYHVTISGTVSDLSNNPLGSDQTWSFTTQVEPPPSVTDTTAADFGAGTLNSCVADASIGDGALRLGAAIEENFSEASLPAGWSNNPWPSGGTSTVSSGLLSVNGAMARNDTFYSSGRTLEFVATFNSDAYQVVGFGANVLTFDNGPWIMFSTGQSGTQLYGRIVTSATGPYNIDDDAIALGSQYLGGPHQYRIVWNPTSVELYIDNVQVVTRNVTISDPMRVGASDYNNNGTNLTVDWLRMSPPFASPCTFTSRVFDAGGTVIWGTLSWTGTTPTGTGLALSYRMGDTPVLTGSWTQASSSGATIGGSSRYIQYQADLSASDTSQTPVLQDVTITHGALIPDTTPPAVTGQTPAPNAVGVAANTNVTVTFSEAMNAGTISASTFSLRAEGAGSDTSAVVTYDPLSSTATLNPDADLAYSTLYHVTVSASVTDLAGLPLGSDSTWSFTTAAAPLPILTDTTAADFSAGTLNSCVADATIGDGAVRLPAALDVDFSGTSLPAGWASYDWPYDGQPGVYTVSGGVISVDGVRVNPEPAAYSPGISLEFVATFAAVANQHIGFGAGNHLPPNDIFNTTPPVWAIFSTGPTGTALMARTWSGTGNIDFTIPGSWLGAPHTYRIDWTSSTVVYSIDGNQVASQPYSASGVTMRPAISDLTLGGGLLTVDWMRLLSYTSPCSFTSRVFDAGQPVNWDNLSWTSNVPAGTGLSVSYRIGSTPTLSGVQWVAVSGSSPKTLAGNSRYIQYQAELSASNSQLTPELWDVTFAYHSGADTTPPTVSGLNAAPNSSGTALITWTTDEPSDSLVQYGTASDALLGSLSSADLVTSHSVQLTSLAIGTTYYYRVISKDAANNSTTFPLTGNMPASFTVPALTFSLTDTSATDFSAGSGTCPVDATVGDGALRLPLTVDEGFSGPGPGLPGGWTSGTWNTGGTATVAGGVLSVDGALGYSNQSFGPGSTLEFRATFRESAFQNIGFAADGSFNAPWIVIGEGAATDGVYARTNTGSSIRLSTTTLGTPHVYRIDWTTSGFAFYVDGTLATTLTSPVPSSMVVVVSDYDTGGGALTVDWVRVTPYISPCAFTSRIFDAGLKADWNALSWTASLPAGTSLNLSVRTGSTPIPDASWTTFTSIANSGDLVGSTSRYLQYRTELATTNSSQTPVLSDVTILYQAATNHPPVAVNDSYSTSEGAPLVIAAPGVLGNDSDVDGDPLSTVLAGGPAHGTLTLNPDGSFTYTPDTDFSGDDSFTYRANDGTLDSMMATVSIHVNPAPPPPTPAHFYGQIFFDENPPAQGTQIQAWVTVAGQTLPVATTIVQAGVPPYYAFDVPGDIPGTSPIEGGVEGGTITFMLNGRTMATAPWQTGTSTQLDFNSVALHLQSGWNLVSFNLVPVSSNAAIVLETISGNFDMVYAWDATGAHSSSGNWMSYYPAVPFGPTLTLTEKMGFWIRMSAPATLQVAGSRPTTTLIPLSTQGGGWNLVGFPAVTPGALPNVLSEHGVLTNFSLVYAYHPLITDLWKMYDLSAPDWVNSLSDLAPGWGYWVKVSSPAGWTVTYP